MLKIVRITPDFAIGAQPSPGDFAEIRAAGFASILNARPDDEDGTYLISTEAKESAHSEGLAYIHSPSENHTLFETDVIDQFERALTHIPSPIFAHCKSGTRTAILWALVAVRHREVDDVIATLREAGQELEFLEDELRETSGEARRSTLRLKDDALLRLGHSALLGKKMLD